MALTEMTREPMGLREDEEQMTDEEFVVHELRQAYRDIIRTLSGAVSSNHGSSFELINALLAVIPVRLSSADESVVRNAFSKINKHEKGFSDIRKAIDGHSGLSKAKKRKIQRVVEQQWQAWQRSQEELRN